MFPETKKLLLVYLSGILLLILIGLLLGCNPVKRVLKDPRKYKKVTDQFVRSGGCINDTTTKITTRDSIIYRDTSYSGLIKSDLPKTCDIDTLFPDGLRLIISNGYISYSLPAKEQEHRQVITQDHYIVDNSRINLLSSDLRSKEDSISDYKLKIRQLNQTISEKNTKIAALKFKFWGLISLIAIGGVITAYLKIKKLF